MGTMTKGERHELLQLIKKREKVMRAAAQERSASLLADFDAHLAKIYHYDEDEVWQKLSTEAQAEVQKANDGIAKRAKAMGIPAEFAPFISFGWHGRGHNAVKERRDELRRAARARIEQLEKEALTQIEAHALQAQTEVVRSGLDSKAANEFLEKMPRWDTIMPAIAVAEMQQLMEARRVEDKRRLHYDIH